MSPSLKKKLKKQKKKLKKQKKKLKKQKMKLINTSALMYMYRDAYEELFDRTDRLY